MRSTPSRRRPVEICTYHLGDDWPGITIHRTPRIPWYNKPAGVVAQVLCRPLLLVKAWRASSSADVIGHCEGGIGWAVGKS
jgi:hypothetical protein